MQISILAIGRLRQSPESDLVSDYISRFQRTGRSLGLGPVQLTEFEAKKGGGQAEEAQLLSKAISDGSLLVALDERGRELKSPEFAGKLASWRDQGRSRVTFILGGADGLEPSLAEQADFQLSLGRMVWPHALARVMLAEQLYRAASILAGLPYHRE